MFTQWFESQILPAFNGRILPVDHLVDRKAAQLPRPDSRQYAMPPATGLVHGATVVTLNTKHFESPQPAVAEPLPTAVADHRLPVGTFVASLLLSSCVQSMRARAR